MDQLAGNLFESVLLDGRYETISPLNHGSYGMVFLARDVWTGDQVAVKCLNKSDSNGYGGLAVDDRSEEVDIHSRIGHHPHIVNLIDSFETEHHVYLVLEFCANGDLYEAIRNGRGPSETERVRGLMLQLIDAVEHLHQRGIYHRDIKPENIFLTDSGSIKLGDFGLATTEALSLERAVGSDRYMAPEQFDPSVNGYSPAQADVWAIGICLLNVLFSRNPFAAPIPSDPLYADFVSDAQSLFDVFPTMSQGTFEILMHCLSIDPARRSLSLVRESLGRVASFTTDDELLDDFCTQNGDLITATANRQPLRTPSVLTPQLGQEVFSWTQALQSTPQQHVEHANGRFSDDLFRHPVEFERDWLYVKPENASVASFADSGLGVSLNSRGSAERHSPETARSKPMSISGTFGLNERAMAPLFGKRKVVASSSWSEMWDEDEENVDSVHEDAALTKDRGTNGSALKSRPRLAEFKNFSVTRSIESPSQESSKDVETVPIRGRGSPPFELEANKVTPRYSPPPKRTAMEKWAALGNRRRGVRPDSENAFTDLTVSSPMLALPVTPEGRKRSASRSTGRRRSRSGIGSRSNVPASNGVACHGTQHGGSQGGSWRRDDWILSKDWRSQNPARQLSSSSPRREYGNRPGQQQQQSELADDIGDLEWVGGWNDFHL